LSGFSSGTFSQLLPRCLASPCARIDVADDVEPFFGLFERREKAHVQPEAFAPVFEAPTHKEIEPLQLGNLCLGERHRRRRRAQVEHVRTGLRSASRCCSTGRRRPCIPGSGACDST